MLIKKWCERNNWKKLLETKLKKYDIALKGNNIVSKLDIVYPVKNGIDKSKKKVYILFYF